MGSGEEEFKNKKSNVRKIIFIFCLLFLLLFISAISPTFGAIHITVTEVYSIIWHGLFQNQETTKEAAEFVIWNIRLPRILMGIAAGIGLGLAGTIMQGVLKNPLASPYTFGVSSGAGFGAALAITLGAGLISIIGRYYIIGIAFIFAFITSLFILYWADRLGATPLGIVIVVILGIAMIWLYATLNSLILYFCEAGVVKEIGFWSVGNLGMASWNNLLPVSIVLVGCILLLLLISLTLKLRDFDAISIRTGTENSPAMENKRVRILIIAIASILVASTISFTGMIAFIGLVAPHIAYVTVGKDNKFLLPAAGLIGALLLVGADTMARTIMTPVIIPVGVITSLIGVPLFIYLLIKIIIRLTR